MPMRLIAWPIAMLVWAAVGFYVWVPAVVVSGAFYIVSLLAVAIEWNGLMKTAEGIFQMVIRFYPDGFLNIHRALFGRPSNSGGDPENVDTEEKVGNFIGFLVGGAIGLAVATLFWALVVGLLDEIF